MTSPDSKGHDSSHVWQAWLGRSERRTDTLMPAVVAALSATLDRDSTYPAMGEAAPPLAHWLLFHSLTRQSALDADGHARRGDFLPPVSLPRRMWAGGRLDFHHPLRIGEELARSSRIVSIESKQGRAGALVFVTVRHEISNHSGVGLVEEQDIVYREAPSAASVQSATPQPASSAAPSAEFEREVMPDSVLLFRYSALTFNSHRIHFDLRYATGEESYPDLVVQGPLTATLLLDLLHRERPQARVRRFTFRALHPLYAHLPFAVCGRWAADQRAAALWTRGPGGEVTMQAQAELA